MLDEKQRATIKKSFGSGISISEIAKKMGVSSRCVYRTIETELEKDPEVQMLKEKIRNTGLCIYCDNMLKRVEMGTASEAVIAAGEAVGTTVYYCPHCNKAFL